MIDAVAIELSACTFYVHIVRTLANCCLLVSRRIDVWWKRGPVGRANDSALRGYRLISISSCFRNLVLVSSRKIAQVCWLLLNYGSLRCILILREIYARSPRGKHLGQKFFIFARSWPFFPPDRLSCFLFFFFLLKRSFKSAASFSIRSGENDFHLFGIIHTAMLNIQGAAFGNKNEDPIIGERERERERERGTKDRAGNSRDKFSI